jgi:coenzyme F420-reducing hydrogenase delta subunit
MKAGFLLNTAALKREGSPCDRDDTRNVTLALFYCQNIPESGEKTRQDLEKQYGNRVRFFPIPCSGRLEPVHLLKALETFADAAYVITCPRGACRYFQGNRRAEKRVQRAQDIIRSIGLEKERLDIVIRSQDHPKTLAQLSKELMERAIELGISSVKA